MSDPRIQPKYKIISNDLLEPQEERNVICFRIIGMG